VPGTAHDDDRLEQLVGDAAVVRDAFEQFPMVLMALDGPEHRLAAMNAAYRAFTGRSDVIGVTYQDAFPELAGQQVFELLDRVYATGEAETGTEWRVQIDLSPEGLSDPRARGARKAPGARGRYSPTSPCRHGAPPTVPSTGC